MIRTIDLQAMSQTQRVTHALTLGLTAPSDAYARQCCEIAESFSVGLSEIEIEGCKSAALQMAEGHIGGEA